MPLLQAQGYRGGYAEQQRNAAAAASGAATRPFAALHHTKDIEDAECGVAVESVVYRLAGVQPPHAAMPVPRYNRTLHRSVPSPRSPGTDTSLQRRSPHSKFHINLLFFGFLHSPLITTPQIYPQGGQKMNYTTVNHS